MFIAADRVNAGNTGAAHGSASDSANRRACSRLRTIGSPALARSHETSDSTAGIARAETCRTWSCWKCRSRRWAKAKVSASTWPNALSLSTKAGSITSCTRWARSSKASWTEVLDLMRRCIEQTATHSDRVTCAAKLDYRRGQSGRLKSKVASVEQKLGREVRKRSIISP